MTKYKRLDQLEQALHERLHHQAVDIDLIVKATHAIIAIGENPNDVYKRLLEVAQSKVKRDDAP